MTVFSFMGGTGASWESVLTPKERIGGPSPMGNSKWGDFRSCPHLYWWKHVKRMKLDEPEDALEIGGLYHELRARYYQFYLDYEHELSREELDRGCVDTARELLERTDKVVPYTSSEARRLFDSWLAAYGPGMPLDDRESTYDVENLLEVSSPFPYSARLDRWIMTEYGPVIMEIKTAGRRDGKLINSYKLDPQFIGQVWLWRKTMSRKYGKLLSFVVDLTTKTNPVGVTREGVSIPDAVIRRWEQDMRYWHMLRIQCETTNTWPKNYGYRCRFCSALDHCATNGKNNAGWIKKKRGDY